MGIEKSRSTDVTIKVALKDDELHEALSDRPMQLPLLIPAKSPLSLSFANQRAGLPLSIYALLTSLDSEAKVSVQSYNEPVDSTPRDHPWIDES